MDKAEFRKKLINLLETEGQTINSLYKIIAHNKCVYCIEGLICKTLGGTIKSSSYDMMILDGKDVAGYIDSSLYSDYLPSLINSDFILSQTQVNLTENQEAQLRTKAYVNWIYLNDKCNFTFPQFIELIKVL